MRLDHLLSKEHQPRLTDHRLRRGLVVRVGGPVSSDVRSGAGAQGWNINTILSGFFCCQYLPLAGVERGGEFGKGLAQCWVLRDRPADPSSD